MSKKALMFFVAITAAVCILFSSGVGLGAPLPASPSPTASPSPSGSAAPTDSADTDSPVGTLAPQPTVPFPALTMIPYSGADSGDSTVNFPDTKLKAALQKAMGMTSSTPIKRSDLGKLAGGLDLSDKGITKLDGLQYCVNITALKLTDNKVTDIPASFSSMVNLTTLLMDNNKLTKMPDSLFTLTKLTVLNLSSNQIAKVPDKINLLAGLTDLNLSLNQIDGLPTNIGRLTSLKTLSLAKNKLRTEKVPKELYTLPELVTLDLSGNVLSALANEAAAMPKLTVLDVTGNILDSLPAGLGNAPSLQKVYAARNRLTQIEPSLLNGKITDLTLDVNRLTDLPQGLKGKTFSKFSVEWNFIDMSDGTEPRGIADSVTAPGGKAYLRQLKTLTASSSSVTSTTATLTWKTLESGTSGDSSWAVNKYQIYLVNSKGAWVDLDGKTKTIADLDSLAGQYVVTGLTADTSYTFQVGVEYTLLLNGVHVTHRIYAPVEVKTLATNATMGPTTEPTDSMQPEQTQPPEISASAAQPSSTAVSAQAKPGASSTLVIILVVVIAVLLIALILETTMLLTRRNPRKF